MIPKIIHQTAPDDPNRWHPVWVACQKSWQNIFPDFHYEMWSDQAINAYIKSSYPQYYTTLKDCKSIIRIDIVRYMIMYEFGGIYADMDMYCYRNFYDEIERPVAIVEMASGERLLENSLMASEPEHEFWKLCIETAFERLLEYQNQSRFSNDDIKYIAGPSLVSDIYSSYFHKEQLYIMRKELYNMGPNYFDYNIYTRHMLTGMWGGEVFDMLMQQKSSSETKEEFLVKNYEEFRSIDMKKFEY